MIIYIYMHMILCMYDTYRSYIEFFVFTMISCLHPILMVITPFSQQETLQTEPFGAVWIVPVSRCPQWLSGGQLKMWGTDNMFGYSR